jgi:hypothetical protein
MIRHIAKSDSIPSLWSQVLIIISSIDLNKKSIYGYMASLKFAPKDARGEISRTLLQEASHWATIGHGYSSGLAFTAVR